MDDTLSEQIAYYRARAGEYDEWFYRNGRYDRGPDLNRRWFDEVESVMRELHRLDPAGEVLELAAGTGIWTEQLVRIADRVTALDASPEVIEINRRKLGDSPRVQYQQTNIFAWEPERQYDLVFFGFWLSHVPPERIDEFLGKVARASRPGGRLFLVDSRFAQGSAAINNPLLENEHIYRTRILNDGRRFRIVKVFYEPAELQRLLDQHGFDAEVRTTGEFFIYATGERRPG